jgi:hypothetical protein
MSDPVETEDDGKTEPLNYYGGQAFTATDNSCPFDSPSTDPCGTWTLSCSASGTFDRTDMYVFTGEGENDGQIVRFSQYFAPNTGCSENQVALSIEARGFWSTYAEDDAENGLLVNFPTLLVTAQSEDLVTSLNDEQYGCPCGKSWSLGVERVLIAACPENTCPYPTLLGDGTAAAVLGKPGYARLIRAGNRLQLSTFMDNANDGIISVDFNLIANLPMNLGSKCKQEEAIANICGKWEMPCQADGSPSSAVYDYTSSFSFDDNGKSGTYTMTREDYAPGLGCDTTQALTVTQTGTLEFPTGQTSAVKNGRAAVLSPSTMTITPKTSDIAQQLQKVCPCNGQWTSGTPRVFSGTNAACPTGTCNDYTWLRQPIGQKAYGSIRRMDEFTRLTSFSDDQSTGFNYVLQPFDYSYTLMDTFSQCSPPPPPGPNPGPGPSPSPPGPGPNPGPGRSTGSKGKMDGGELFLLLFFVFVVVYLVGGMVMNYVKSGGANGGVPAIPHARFWREEFCGLVADGVNFAVCRLCGTRGVGGPRYAEFGGNPDNNYGAL